MSSDKILYKSPSLDSLRHRSQQATKELRGLIASLGIAHGRFPDSVRLPTLPRTIVSRILTISLARTGVHVQNHCFGRHRIDSLSEWFSQLNNALIIDSALRHDVLSSATASVGLQEDENLPLALEITDPVRLCVVFNYFDDRRFNDGASPSRTLVSLLKHASRWRKVYIMNHNCAAVLNFLEACSPALPYLQHLEFDGCMHIEPGDAKRMANLWINAGTRLKSANINISSQCLRIFTTTGVFEQVCSLKLYLRQPQNEVELVRALEPLAWIQHLESLTILFDGESAVEAAHWRMHIETLYLPSLRQLRLTDFTPTAILALVKNLRAHSVKELALEEVNSPLKSSTSLLPTLFASFPNLEYFSSDHVRTLPWLN